MITERLTKRLINGHFADNDNVIARCHLLTHRGYLTKNLIKSHECIEKKCSFFEKLKPEYWEALEKKEQMKKNNRLKKRQAIEETNERDKLIKETLERSGNVYVTQIKAENPRLLVISYIYDKRIDLSEEIQFLKTEFLMTIKLQAKIGSDETIELLIRRPRRLSQKVTDLRKAPKIGIVTKKRLAALGVYCLEDLYGRNGDKLYQCDCERSGVKVNRRFLTAYRSAVDYANKM
jgi:predicted GIY-YIG superfamily endonuclease